MDNPLRKCMTGIFILTLGTLVAIGATWLPHLESIAYAQSNNVSCVPPPYPPSRTLELVARIPQSDPRDQARGEFARREAFVFLEGNEIICLASSADGRGVLQVDDHLEFQVTHADGSIASWTYDFYDRTTRGITTTLPQNVSRLFAPRLNGIRVTLRDFFPNYYSASPIWLVIWQSPTPTLTTALIATSTPLVTPTRVPLPTIAQPATSTPIPTQGLTPTSVVVAPVGTPTATPERAGSETVVPFDSLVVMILVPVGGIAAVLLMRNWWAGKDERRWKSKIKEWDRNLNDAEAALSQGNKEKARKLSDRVIQDIIEFRKSRSKPS